jgi:hypothetical protein
VTAGVRLIKKSDERGAALPLAMVTLVLLASLLISLSILSATEPLIASNQLQTAQAHALAEAGIERALWAVQRPEAADGLPYLLPNPVPAPYDGSRLIALSTNGNISGGFRLTVSPGTAPNEREVLSIGWMPTDEAGDPRPKAHRRISATLWRVRVPADIAPCALCVLGDLALDDAVTVDARADLRCGGKWGSWSSGTVSVASSAQVLGSDGNDTPNETSDYRQGQPAGAAIAWSFGHADLLALKRLARARGTYYQGTVIFDSSNRVPDGLVFVDTTTGTPVTGVTPAEELARVELRNGAFKGWLVVAGTVEISGDARMRGLVYAQDGFAYRGVAPGGIDGQVVAVGLRGGGTTFSRTGGGTALTFDCAAARDGDGTVPAGWRLKAGSYRDPPDS